MPKILLYYKFAPIKDPEAVCLWQKSLCARYGLKGRILIAKHGINGTLGGNQKALKAYVKAIKLLPVFKDMDFKWSDGLGNDFPKLSVKVRDEIVTFGVAEKIKVNGRGIVGGGQRLKPSQVHDLLAKRGEEVIFFDGRNTYEASVGRFKNALVPNVGHSRDFLKELQDPKYEAIKSKPVITYCTGGIRCEVLSMLMKEQGFQEVYQLDGGIAKYGEKYGDDGLWEGALYVFDGRVTTKFSKQAPDIGSCVHCGGPTSRYTNCQVKTCNRHILVCLNCQSEIHCPDCLAQPVK